MKNKINIFWKGLTYRSGYKTYIERKINFTIREFYNLGLLQQPTLSNELSKEYSVRNESIKCFIQYFNSKLLFTENVSVEQKQMLYDFYYFFFYNLFAKYYNDTEFELDFKIINNSEQVLCNPRKNNQLICDINLNNVKRSYYYDFLDEFQKIEGYNPILKRLLKEVL
ncbi:hypothetical protein H9M94_01350 [Mycoplasma sp. Pen4]|uniref:hypothetical protein n=1 Tax=Mycoplasma sp. Pen4 TaxID=640330 RepID=UPI0016547528|nr:hypothetical protein [Mycoplasma sp. Pen4]QNM93903.1 hypothetical protein H9M94_01350 [Mycoplasma sp. Pen4]